MPLDALVVPEAPPDPAALEVEPSDAAPLPDEPQPAQVRTIAVRHLRDCRENSARRAMIVISRMWTWRQWQETIEPAHATCIGVPLQCRRRSGKHLPLSRLAGSPPIWKRVQYGGNRGP